MLLNRKACVLGNQAESQTLLILIGLYQLNVDLQIPEM